MFLRGSSIGTRTDDGRRTTDNDNDANGRHTLNLYYYDKPIGALPRRDFVLMRMVLYYFSTYSTRFGLVHQKRGGTLRGLRIKKMYFNPPQASIR
jgi:hypothetical protein